MRCKIGLTAIFMIFICSCSINANFFPISGPFSSQIPVPMIVAKVDGILGNSGNIVLTLPDGEKCQGKWSSMAPTQTTVTSSNTQVKFSDGLASAWATAYGTNFSISNVPGINKGEAMIIGDRGTIIQAEFYTGSGTASGSGVAKDNKGNIYKLIF